MLFFKRQEEIIFSVIDNLIVVRLGVGKQVRYIMKCVIENKDCIFIGDISPAFARVGRYENRGYGTKMMQYLIDYAVENNFKEIYGNLAEIDFEHRDRLEHFYKKLGFNIITIHHDGNMKQEVVRKYL